MINPRKRAKAGAPRNACLDRPVLSSGMWPGLRPLISWRWNLRSPNVRWTVRYVHQYAINRVCDEDLDADALFYVLFAGRHDHPCAWHDSVGDAYRRVIHNGHKDPHIIYKTGRKHSGKILSL